MAPDRKRRSDAGTGTGEANTQATREAIWQPLAPMTKSGKTVKAHVPRTNGKKRKNKTIAA